MRHRARPFTDSAFHQQKRKTECSCSSGKHICWQVTGVRCITIRIEFKRFSNSGNIKTPGTRTINLFLPRLSQITTTSPVRPPPTQQKVSTAETGSLSPQSYISLSTYYFLLHLINLFSHYPPPSSQRIDN